MQTVVDSGTGTAAKFSSMPVAGKTGTSTNEDNSDKDVWFAGYTPYYICTVWGGYDDNKALNDSVFHLKIWRSVMNRIHEGLEVKDFELPASVERKQSVNIRDILL